MQSIRKRPPLIRFPIDQDYFVQTVPVYRSGSLEQAAHGDLPVYSVSGPILRKR